MGADRLIEPTEAQDIELANLSPDEEVKSGPVSEANIEHVSKIKITKPPTEPSVEKAARDTGVIRLESNTVPDKSLGTYRRPPERGDEVNVRPSSDKERPLVSELTSLEATLFPDKD